MTWRRGSEGYRGGYVLWGPPGTGKTTLLAAQVEKIMATGGGPVLLCSLTRTAAAELARRDLSVPREMVGTLHSHAYRALDRPRVAEAMLKEWNEEVPEYRLSGGMAEVDDLAGDDSVERNKLKLLFPADHEYEQYQLLRARMVDRRSWQPSVRRFAKRWEQFKRDAGAVDFTDMVDLARQKPAPGAPRVIIADEAQDLSALEFDLLRTWGKEAGALMIAGDPYQALYTWRGAHPEIFMEPSLARRGRRKILSQSYRVPRAVHAAAMAWVKDLSNYEPIEYRPTEVEGDIRLLAATWRSPERVIDLAQELLDEELEVMLCASCSFMITPLVAVLRQRGMPFANPWRRKRGDWNPMGRSAGTTMSERLVAFFRADPLSASDGEVPRWWTWQEINRWVDVMRSGQVMVRGAKKAVAIHAAESPDDIAPWPDVASLLAPEARHRVGTWFKERGLRALGAPMAGSSEIGPMLDWFLESVLATKRKVAAFPVMVARRHGLKQLQQPPRLYVGTIHSFKGAEADVVVIFPDLSPEGKRQYQRRGDGRDSVIRAFYVALTRARRTVVVCRARSPELAVDLAQYAT